MCTKSTGMPIEFARLNFMECLLAWLFSFGYAYNVSLFWLPIRRFVVKLNHFLHVICYLFAFRCFRLLQEPKHTRWMWVRLSWRLADSPSVIPISRLPLIKPLLNHCHVVLFLLLLLCQSYPIWIIKRFLLQNDLLHYSEKLKIIKYISVYSVA